MFTFDLQMFAISGGGGGNTLPQAIINVAEQQNFLDTKFRNAMRPTRVLRASASRDASFAFQGRIGESKTFTRAGLIAPNVVPLNPANNTGLDNGITPNARSFEQWSASLNEWADGLNINVLGNEAILADLYLDDVDKLGQKAGDSLEMVSALRLFQAYDSGDTYLTVLASATTTLTVDDITGFQTQYTAGQYGLPAAVSAGNKLAILILNPATNAVIQAVNVTGFAATGTSYKVSGPLTVGVAGTLTVDAAVTAPINSRVVAMDPLASTTTFNPTFKDGSVVFRPNNRTTGQTMVAGDVLQPSTQFPQLSALLRRRQVPKLPNGLYGVAVDATLMSYLYQDSGFQIATQGTWDRSPVFTNGIIAKAWGLEFVEHTQLPVYQAPAGGFALRHAIGFGAEALAEHPFTAALSAQSRAASIGDMYDFRWVDRIQFITQSAIDRLAEVIKLSYKYVGDFQCPTDKLSNPQNILASDYTRFKRACIIQAASTF